MDPRNQFLLSMGANLMGRPASPNPQGAFGGLGAAMNQGMGAFQNAMVLQQAQAKAAAERKKAEAEAAALRQKQEQQERLQQVFGQLLKEIPEEDRPYWQMRGQLDLNDALESIYDTLHPAPPESPIGVDDLPAEAAMALWAQAGNAPGQQYTPEQVMSAMQATQKPETPPRSTEKERTVERLMTRINPETGERFTREEAENQVYFTRQEINPHTGVVVRHDLLGNSVTEVPFANPETPEPQPADGSNLFESVMDATGLASTPKAWLENLGALLGSTEEQPTTEARARFSNASQSLIRSLAENPRFPVAEMDAIRAELDIKPGMFTGEQTLTTKMTELKGFLEQKVARYERDAANTALASDVRADYRKSAQDIRAFLAVMGEPDDAPQGGVIKTRMENGRIVIDQ